MHNILSFACLLGKFSQRILALPLVFLTLSTCPVSAIPPRKAPITTKRAPQLIMAIAKRGTIIIDLYPDTAPKTVAHVIALVNRKFYDGLLFHRVIVDFVAQTGESKSRNIDGTKLHGLTDVRVAQMFGLGKGGSGKTVPLEAKLPHERGTVGLARPGDAESGDCQFFFNLKNNPSMDFAYTVFGRVSKGLNVMDKIQLGDRITSVRVTKGNIQFSAPDGRGLRSKPILR
ncbi:MAG: Peptidyl-prolyl cis-trans isomerase (rotamase)-cyclophilin family [Chthonomonadaceae bacterium]|nr:Peptidyl-prolyl cis-trans isomerase (rotamase)-cyclophilin family [Chthonomonadaceae bacterium]